MSGLVVPEGEAFEGDVGEKTTATPRERGHNLRNNGPLIWSKVVVGLIPRQHAVCRGRSFDPSTDTRWPAHQHAQWRRALREIDARNARHGRLSLSPPGKGWGEGLASIE